MTVEITLTASAATISTPTMLHRKSPSFVATVFQLSRWTNTRVICRSNRTNVQPVGYYIVVNKLILGDANIVEKLND